MQSQMQACLLLALLSFLKYGFSSEITSTLLNCKIALVEKKELPLDVPRGSLLAVTAPSIRNERVQ